MVVEISPGTPESEEEDDKIWEKMITHPEVARRLTTKFTDKAALVAPHMRSAREDYHFRIFADERQVGRVGMYAPTNCRTTYFVGFFVDYDFWGQGICTEALRQLVKFAFEEVGIHKLHGDNDSDNPASGRVMEKAGFEKVAVFKEHHYSNGQYVDVVHWSLINPGDRTPNR